MKKVAIIGIQGIPARYGGFETLAENLVYKRSEEVRYGVFCSALDMHTEITRLNGCSLWYVRMHSHGLQSILYDIYSMWKARKVFDTMLILGVSGCIFLPILKCFTKAKIVVNIDGLEYKRAKWGGLTKSFLKFSEMMAVKFADTVIADNKAIAGYVEITYHKIPVLIAYGGDDQTAQHISEEHQQEILKRYDVNLDKGYALSICRIEPDNNVEMILKAFAESPDANLVFLGNWNVSKYSQNLRAEYRTKKNILLLDANFDKHVLYTLRRNCSMYIHGHSAGGTNPTLVEQMFYGKPILAYDVIYNRYTTNQAADYFTDVESLKHSIRNINAAQGAQLKKFAEKHYSWQKIVKQYEDLL